MTTSIFIIFLVVYLGMFLGELPYLQLDRTGVALLGAIALISIDAVTLSDAAEAVHLPTIILLFSFMVLSAQMRLGEYRDALRLIAAYPWFGVGFGAAPEIELYIAASSMVS